MATNIFSLSEYRRQQNATPQNAAAIFERQTPAERARALTIAAGFYTETITEGAGGQDVEQQRQLFCMMFDALPQRYKQAACDLINREERLFK